MIKKIALFTDIHFGRKNNSPLHNQDCADYIDWFCANVKKDKSITHIIFMGDWFENRNAVNIMTLDYAEQSFKQLNSLNLPVYVIIGNHDLYHRENRKIFSTKVFQHLTNIILVNEPVTIDDKILICPFLFKDEYPSLGKYQNIPYWFGHFEFRNFIVTGSDRKMEHGLDHKQFIKPKFIFSGHYHKRQALDNVVYIGNTFPADYGDAWDDARGMATIDLTTDHVDFIDWTDCPKYRKVKLSDVLTSEIQFPQKCRVRCVIDIEVAYSEAQILREEMIKLFNLREFTLEENTTEKKDVISGNDTSEEFDMSSLDDAVIKMLKSGITGTNVISADKLIDIYNGLK